MSVGVALVRVDLATRPWSNGGDAAALGTRGVGRGGAPRGRTVGHAPRILKPDDPPSSLTSKPTERERRPILRVNPSRFGSIQCFLLQPVSHRTRPSEFYEMPFSAAHQCPPLR